ncbi:hypothetical protein SAMN02744784_03921 [Stenotrophomonas sp. CC120223-11]|nr:hypothetical protein SAMN02744784_03921 [Stenotrophomonas sp. CC120223-11]
MKGPGGNKDDVRMVSLEEPVDVAGASCEFE